MTDYYNGFLKDCAMNNAGLLGNIQEDKYVISRDIVNELIKIDKEITTYKEEYALLEAKVLDKTLNFKIKFKIDEIENRKFASLYILEEFKHFKKVISYETFLVNFNDINDADYLTKLTSALNITTKNNGENKETKYKSAILENIFKEKKLYSKMLTNELGFDNRKYVHDVLKLLQKSGPFGKKIQHLLAERLKGINLDKNSVLYWQKVKEILDELLFEYMNESSEETRKWLELINQNYVLMHMMKSKKVKNFKQTATENVSAPKKDKGGKDKKGGGGSKPKKPAKKASKKPAKSGDKKPAKKEEAKKSVKINKEVKPAKKQTEIKIAQKPQQEEKKPDKDKLLNDLEDDIVSGDDVDFTLLDDDLFVSSLDDEVELKGEEVTPEVESSLGYNFEEIKDIPINFNTDIFNQSYSANYSFENLETTIEPPKFNEVNITPEKQNNEPDFTF